MQSGVYKIVNIIDGKQYIGSSIDIASRLTRHRGNLNTNKHENLKLQRAWNKHNKDSFVFEVLLYCDPENCLWYEQMFLDYFQPEYNIALDAKAPMLGRTHSVASRYKMSQSRRGTQTGVDNPMYGKTGDQHPYFGRRHSDESKQKMRASHLGKKLTQSTKNKMSQSRRGELHPNAKLTTEQVVEIKKKIADGIPNRSIALQYGIHERNISKIKTGRNWSHV